MDPLFLAPPRVSTFLGQTALTKASGVLFVRDKHLFRVASRHVAIIGTSQHLPDWIERELHIDGTDLTRSIGFSMPLNGTWYADILLTLTGPPTQPH